MFPAERIPQVLVANLVSLALIRPAIQLPTKELLACDPARNTG